MFNGNNNQTWNQQIAHRVIINKKVCMTPEASECVCICKTGGEYHYKKFHVKIRPIHGNLQF
jgi:hypothetical protein